MNEGIADMVGQTDRFWGIGQLPLQSTELSLKELDHVRALGLSGVEVGANVEQKELDDESLVQETLLILIGAHTPVVSGG